jgi:hypothetical protein
MNIKSHFAEAVGYWERKRIVYNGVLALLVFACWGEDILSGSPGQWLCAATVLLVLTGIANALYCAAYPVDLAYQMTPLKSVWPRRRWLLFTSGLALASTLALWVMLHTGMA